MRKVIEQESISDANNVTEYTFSHKSNTQTENVNTIFTSDKIDKSNDLVDTVNNLIINDAEYFKSNKDTASDTQGDLPIDPETLNTTSNGNETVTHTSNGNVGQK